MEEFSTASHSYFWAVRNLHESSPSKDLLKGFFGIVESSITSIFDSEKPKNDCEKDGRREDTLGHNVAAV